MEWNLIIKALREDKDLTQTTLAKILNTTQRTISNWEAGRNEPPYETLKEYAKYFNVTTDYILGLTNDPIPNWNIKNQINISGGKNKINIE